MRWYWHVVALTLIVGGTGVSVVTGTPLPAWVGALAWLALWFGVVRRRVIT